MFAANLIKNWILHFANVYWINSRGSKRLLPSRGSLFLYFYFYLQIKLTDRIMFMEEPSSFHSFIRIISFLLTEFPFLWGRNRILVMYDVGRFYLTIRNDRIELCNQLFPTSLECVCFEWYSYWYYDWAILQCSFQTSTNIHLS